MIQENTVIMTVKPLDSFNFYTQMLFSIIFEH